MIDPHGAKVVRSRRTDVRHNNTFRILGFLQIFLTVSDFPFWMSPLRASPPLHPSGCPPLPYLVGLLRQHLPRGPFRLPSLFRPCPLRLLFPSTGHICAAPAQIGQVLAHSAGDSSKQKGDGKDERHWKWQKLMEEDEEEGRREGRMAGWMLRKME